MKKGLLLIVVATLTLGNVAFAGFPITEHQIINSFNDECDNIILRDGNEISAQIVEITPDMIKYKKCSDIDGPIISMYKSDVMMVRYKDGSKDIFKNEQANVSTTAEDGLLGNGFAIAALICGILGFVVPGLGLLSIIFGAIGAGKKRKGRGMAITGMILGIVNLIVVLALLASY
tara:strand:- start:634 stop:1158 length:525 start_codon:yes stop_codon:yes gene_type:complete